MKSKAISVAEAAASFSTLLSQVRNEARSFDIVEDGRIVARLSPPVANEAGSLSKLNQVLQSLPHLSPGEAQKFSHDVKAGLRALRTDRRDW